MSKFPTAVKPFATPQEAFDNLLTNIIATSPPKRETLIKPYLCTFIAHPIIKQLLEHSEDPAPVKVTAATNPDLKQIQDSLSALSKAVDCLSKGNAPAKKPPNAHKTQKSRDTSQKTQRTYSAVAESSPPNPSLVADLAHLDFPDRSRPRPELICATLNKKLGEVSPPQVQLAAVRWTAKGNLVIIAGPSSTPASLLAAAPHINTILTTTLKLPSHSPSAQPRANIKWSKITINGVPTGASSTRGPGPHTPLKSATPH